MSGEWLKSAELYRDLPAKLIAQVASYACADETKLEILANCLIVMDSDPFLEWPEILRKARSLRMRERMGRFDRCGHDVPSSPELPELSYWEKPEEDRDQRNEELFRQSKLVKEILNSGSVFGDMLANGMSVTDAARVAGIPLTTAQRRVNKCATMLLRVQRKARAAE